MFFIQNLTESTTVNLLSVSGKLQCDEVGKVRINIAILWKRGIGKYVMPRGLIEIEIVRKNCVYGKASKIKNKKVWNFPYISGMGGFERVIFHKNKNYKKWSKNAQNCLNIHLKATYYFQYRRLSDRIFLRFKWLIDLPDLEIFLRKKNGIIVLK